MSLSTEAGTYNLRSDTFEANLRVIYADTDSMAVVYHAKYLEYFEFARNEMLREIGFPYKMLEQKGLFLPVIEAHLEYIKPAFYDDLLTIRTTTYQEANRYLRFKIACEIYREQDLLVRGFTVHFTSNAGGKASRPPRSLFQELLATLLRHRA